MAVKISTFRILYAKKNNYNSSNSSWTVHILIHLCQNFREYDNARPECKSK